MMVKGCEQSDRLVLQILLGLLAARPPSGPVCVELFVLRTAASRSRQLPAIRSRQRLRYVIRSGKRRFDPADGLIVTP